MACKFSANFLKDLRANPIILSGGASALAQALNFALSVILIAIIQSYHGLETLGVWLAATTLIMLMSASDLGVGHAVISIASKIGRKDNLKGHILEICLAATLITGCISLALLSIFVGISANDWWVNLFNYDADAAQGVTRSFFLYLGVFLAVSVPLSVVERLQTSQQRAYIPRICEVLGSLLGLVVCTFLLKDGVGLGSIFLSRYLPYFVIRFLNSFLFWASFARCKARPSRARTAYYSKKIRKVGASFFIISLTSAIALNSDVLLISYILGSEKVPEYSIPYRLFMIPSMFVGLFSIPLWPAYSAAIARRDWHTVKRLYYRSLVVASIVTVSVCGSLVMAGDQIIHFWLGTVVHLPAGMVASQAIWCIIVVLGGVASPLLNALSMERAQAKMSVVMALLNLPLSVFLIGEMGPQGAMWGSVISTFFAITIPLHGRLLKILRPINRSAPAT